MRAATPDGSPAAQACRNSLAKSRVSQALSAPSVTIHDLVCDAIRDEADAVNDASRYIRILKAAGYLAEMRGRAPGSRPGSNGFKRFRLIRNTGPRAPLHRSKLAILHDFNTGEDVACSPC